MTRRQTGRPIPVHQRPSPNHTARRTPIDMIVLHYTGMSSLPDVLDKLCDPASEVSAHFVVDVDGRIFQLVGEEHRAWHAGVANWQGQRDVNSRSIGIEIMNNGKTLFTDEQINSVLSICKTMMTRYNIPPYHVVGHSDVAPGRKSDPGHLFPWRELAHYGIGLYPEPTLVDYFATTGKKGDLHYVRSMLAQLGYGNDFSPNPTPPLRDLIAAFQSRYEPDVYTHAPDEVGIPTHRTLALLRAGVRALGDAQERHRRLTALRAEAAARPTPPGNPPPSSSSSSSPAARKPAPPSQGPLS